MSINFTLYHRSCHTQEKSNHVMINTVGCLFSSHSHFFHAKYPYLGQQCTQFQEMNQNCSKPTVAILFPVVTYLLFHLKKQPCDILLANNKEIFADKRRQFPVFLLPDLFPYREKNATVYGCNAYNYSSHPTPKRKRSRESEMLTQRLVMAEPLDSWFGQLPRALTC